MRRSGAGAPLLTAFVLAAALVAGTAFAQADATIGIIATDAVTTGNTASSLGPLNGCVRAETGTSVNVDVVVDAVPEERGVIGFQFTVMYDPAILTLTAVDNEFLLSANGSYEPFEGLSDPLPDDDGQYVVLVADLASNPDGFQNIETGPGVLARLTFAAKAAGESTVGLNFDPPNDYPAVIDIQNTTIGVDRLGTARVAVGQDCDAPPEATPEVQELPPIEELDLPTPEPTPPEEDGTPTPTEGTGEPGSPTETRGTGTEEPSPTERNGGNTIDEDDDGTSTGTVAVVAALAIAGAALAGGGAWMLLRRRPGGEGGPPAAG